MVERLALVMRDTHLTNQPHSATAATANRCSATNCILIAVEAASEYQRGVPRLYHPALDLPVPQKYHLDSLNCLLALHHSWAPMVLTGPVMAPEELTARTQLSKPTNPIVWACPTGYRRALIPHQSPEPPGWPTSPRLVRSTPESLCLESPPGSSPRKSNQWHHHFRCPVEPLLTSVELAVHISLGVLQAKS